MDGNDRSGSLQAMSKEVKAPVKRLDDIEKALLVLQEHVAALDMRLGIFLNCMEEALGMDLTVCRAPARCLSADGAFTEMAERLARAGR